MTSAVASSTTIAPASMAQALPLATAATAARTAVTPARMVMASFSRIARVCTHPRAEGIASATARLQVGAQPIG
jgi:hypothetical protein